MKSIAGSSTVADITTDCVVAMLLTFFTSFSTLVNICIRWQSTLIWKVYLNFFQNTGACESIQIKTIANVTAAGIRSNSIVAVMLTPVAPFTTLINI